MTTPMRSQYLALKKQYPDIILLFRLGDFYETFDDDARIVASVCDIVLTSRPVGNDERIPLAGVPYHAVDNYIAKLIAAGYRVAIAEQVGTEPPKGEKIVPRVVRRVVTAGTLVEPALLPEKRNNYVAALVLAPNAAGLAFADISTGEFATCELTDGGDVLRRVAEELSRIGPAEVLHAAKDPRWAKRATEDGGGSADAIPAVLAPFHVTPYAAWRFEESTARAALLEHFRASSLEGFGCESKSLAIRAAGGLLQYLQETQMEGLPQLIGLRTYGLGEFMTLDEATRRNLELTETIRGGSTHGSLLGVLDATLTPMGGRLLRRWLGQPLLDVAALEARLDRVESWQADAMRRAELREVLRGLGDLERWTNRCVQGIALPRDLFGIREALGRVEKVAALLEGDATAFEELDGCPELARLLWQAIDDNPPATLASAGVIRPGFSAELDGIHLASRDAKMWIANLESVERARTGIKTLKVGYNRVFGYYIEVTQANSALVPTDYIRKQTLVNAERYITPELKEYESLVLNADERVLELEGQLYKQVLAQVAAAASHLLGTASRLAELDVFAALAEVAEANRYVRPALSEDGVIDIRDGRHPVVERLLTGATPFTPNDAHLSPAQAIVVLTGPNMAGKSTWIRQVAMIVLMAQIGSFVPAEMARIGVVDRIFTRIGASDEIARGQSTFMVEMVETANILHHATSRSLLILDEIGRGTSTYDGLAIAWAVIEYIHNHPGLRAKTLFATHYHELTDLAERLPHVVNFNVAVAEQGDTVAFLHKIVPGAADRSYGVHVAQLAGLPRPVVNARLEEILADLEASGAAGPRRSALGQPVLFQLPLFSTEDPVLAELKVMDVNSLSPLAALNKLYELQQRAKKGNEANPMATALIDPNFSQIIAKELGLPPHSVNAAVALLDDGNTIPFIARYRKEATGNLDEVQLRQVEARLEYLRKLTERRVAIVEEITSQGKLTDELAQQIDAATTLQALEDLYRPYKPKRQTRAAVARERGLEPLSQALLAQDPKADPLVLAAAYVGEQVPDAGAALAGARDIIAEQVSDDPNARLLVRQRFAADGFVMSQRASEAADEAGRYRVYYEFRCALRAVQPHQWLALARGGEDGSLKVEIDTPDADVAAHLVNRWTRAPGSRSSEHVRLAIEDGYDRLLRPSIEREVSSQLGEYADDHAIQVFAANLRNLLLQPPLRERTVMGIDPGFRSGCKVATVGPTGKLLDTLTIYPHPPQNEAEKAKAALAKLVKLNQVSVIAIGNGTASRETEALVVALIRSGEKSELTKLAYVMVSEAGASVYSASDVARAEFPNLDVSMRGAVSIARRLQDPLAELVKIDPKSIGVGLYQHDVDQGKLASALDTVVESVVNHVGVDANTASAQLLSYVSGISKKVAASIVTHRDENGAFESRTDLKKVKGLGPKAFEQAAGFLRVPGSRNLLDNTTIHPESYAATKALLELAGLNLRMKDLPNSLRRWLAGEGLDLTVQGGKWADIAGLLGIGEPTLRDIVQALLRPGRDPRDDLPPVVLRRDILSIEDLREGMVLKGTVRNVVDFGAFVDIGVKQDGLVHISKMGKKFVRNPHEVVGVGDVIDVEVVNIDRERGRIGLAIVVI